MTRLARLALAVVALAAWGCGPDVRIEERWDTAPPLRLAVLPFSSPDEEERTLDEVDFLRHELTRELADQPLLIVEPERVDARLSAAGIDGAEDLDSRTPAELAELLGADAVVYGDVESLSNLSPIVGYYRYISCEVRCVGADGEELWRVDHTEREAGGPLVDLGSQVITSVIDQIENSSNLAFVKLAERWAERCVERIPTPSGADQEALATGQASPEIGAFDARSSRSGALGPGDRLTLRVSAAPGMRVTVEIGPGVWASLAEVAPGEYRAVYVVQVGDAIEREQLVAVARNEYGRIGKRLLQQPVRIDARPPATPTDLKAGADGPGVVLKWSAPPADGVRFAVYRTSVDDPGNPVELAEVDGQTYRDSAADTGAAYRYSVVARRGALVSHPATTSYRP